MKVGKISIYGIPALIWGCESSKVYIAVHGNMSSKDDEVIKLLANIVTSRGYQLLSFDLPEHGERKNDVNYLCKVQNCVFDLKTITEYAKKNYNEINLWACSVGAYFSLLAYKNEKINRCLFLSPVVNMEMVIDNLMLLSNVTVADLEEKLEIKTRFGQTLYWDYYLYVKNNKITNWDKDTYILYGDNDNIQDINTIKEFSTSFKCNLLLLTDGEHYFHTEEQLNYYIKWLNEVVK